MAKKKKNKADLKSDEIIDSLADEVGANDEDAQDERVDLAKKEPVVPEGEDEAEAEATVVDDEAPGEIHGRAARAKAEFAAWPCEPDHGSARDLLQKEGASVDLSAEYEAAGGKAVNMVLLLLLIAVGGAGFWYFNQVSSPEALAAKRAEKEEAEKLHLEEQLAKQKKYGVLRIESTPEQADIINASDVDLELGGFVCKPNEKCVVKSEETGEDIVVRSPANLLNMDIGKVYKLRLEKDGYEPFEFAVAEHLWTKDTTGEFKFFKAVELTPTACEYWFLYDAKKKRELKFDERTQCLEHYDDAVSNQVSVTECTCKLLPEGAAKPDEKKDDKK